MLTFGDVAIQLTHHMLRRAECGFYRRLRLDLPAACALPSFDAMTISLGSRTETGWSEYRSGMISRWLMEDADAGKIRQLQVRKTTGVGPVSSAGDVRPRPAPTVAPQPVRETLVGNDWDEV